MATKKVTGERIPRVQPSEIYPTVGEAAEKLKVVSPVFGETLVNAVVSAVTTGQVRHGELELVNLGEPSQSVKVIFDNPVGSKDLKIKLSGNWSKIVDIPLDNPLYSPVKGIIYRKRQADDKKAIVEEGQTIPPGGAICAISQTKSNIWYLELPGDIFPKGGVLTKFVVGDGKEADKGEVLCYIKKIE